MINKQLLSIADAVRDVQDGATIMVGGFGEAGSPMELIHALIDQGASDLTLISNNTGNGRIGLAALIGAGRVRRVVCSYPRSSNSVTFQEQYAKGALELELVPQGTLAERIRAGGAGIPAFFTRTSAGTVLAEGKETRVIDGIEYVLETALTADFALTKALTADPYGNLLYNKTARNFNPLMCAAAKTTIVQVASMVKVGAMNPEHVVTPAIYVDRIVEVADPLIESELVKKGYVYPC